MRKSIGLNAMKDKALNFLNTRAHSSFELKRKLLQRRYSESLIDELVKELNQIGLLNDESFAESYLDSLIRYKSFGFYGLKAKLKQRGIEQALIERLLKEKLDEQQEFLLAQKALERMKEKDPIKLAQALSRKGFRTQVIKRALNI